MTDQDRYAPRPCGCPPYYDGTHLDGCSEAAGRRRVLSFTGTLGAFLDYLDSWHTAGQLDRATAAGQTYEWELTAAIARHPAGKSLLAECDAIRRERWEDRSDG